MLSLTLTVGLLLASNPTPAKAPAAPAHAEHAADAKSHGACDHPADAKAAPAKSEGEVVVRGAPLQGKTAVAVKDLLATPDAFAGKTVLVEATVRKACSNKGCWMELAESQAAKGPGVRVTFKDYAFFVPLDSAGSQAKVEGVVKLAELSDAKAKHFEEEGATVTRGADGKAREVQLVATGVELRRPTR